MPAAVGRRELTDLVEVGAQLVEVLPKDEYDQEHLPGAIQLALKSLTGTPLIRSSTGPAPSSSTAGMRCET
jgi:rhodanese-related sulfurtransferase